MSSPEVLDSGLRAASFGYLEGRGRDKVESFPEESQPHCLPPTFVPQSLPAPSPLPKCSVLGRAQHGFQELLDLVGVRVYFGAVQQEWELSTRAKLLNGLCPSGEGPGMKRGEGIRSRNRDMEMGEKRICPR